jgi:hypothetical protein
VILQNPRHLVRRRPPEGAIGGKPKIRQEFAPDIDALRE